jgi:hypothetical protein
MTKKAGLIGGLVLAGLGSTVVAFAYWSATGSGSGSATAITAKQITVSGLSLSADLYPGGPPGAVGLKLNDPNPYGVYVTFLQSGWGTPVSNTSGCASSYVSIDPKAPAVGTVTLIPGTTTTIAMPGVLDLSPNAPDACQGATFSVPLTGSGGQLQNP